MSSTKTVGNYADVNGINLYYESTGTGGTPVVVLHGGFGSTGMVASMVADLSSDRQVIAVDLQGHGRTADIERPLWYEHLADDIAALIGHLGIDKADIVGYSLGGGTALRTAIQHPDRIGKLVVVSSPMRRNAWYPEVLEGMSQVNRGGFDGLRQSPMYQNYVEIAPDPDAFPELMDKMGGLLTTEYDWTDEVGALTLPVMLIFGDADSIPISHIAEFFQAVGGGQEDAGWDLSKMPRSRLALLPATTHYDIFTKPELPELIAPFLGRP